jgi:hypothetical protein
MAYEGYELIGSDYRSTSDVPKDRDIYYRCDDCGDIIPSVPAHNVGCKCGNVFIDKDYWRLVVAKMNRLSSLRRIS